MKIKCLSCKALARIVYRFAATSPHIIDVELFEIGLHNEPEELNKTLQERLDAVEVGDYDAIVMGYGLCGKALEGIIAPAGLPVVIPRAHDCITLFLGSRSRYQTEFEENTGTYWYSADYIERNSDSNQGMSLGAETVDAGGSNYDEMVKKYGRENADYLIEVMGGWQQHYNRAAYLAYDFYQSTAAESQARNDAKDNDWRFDQVAANLILIKQLLYGDWAQDDFLRLEPGQKLEMANDAGVIRAA